MNTKGVTAEEILEKHIVHPFEMPSSKLLIIAAMEEYASTVLSEREGKETKVDTVEKPDLKHSPLPWTIEEHGNGYALYSGRTGMQHGLNLLFLSDPDWNWNNNREFILKACNSYYQLQSEVSELKREVERLKGKAGEAFEAGQDYESEAHFGQVPNPKPNKETWIKNNI